MTHHGKAGKARPGRTELSYARRGRARRCTARLARSLEIGGDEPCSEKIIAVAARPGDNEPPELLLGLVRANPDAPLFQSCGTCPPP
jgi:hypothetical protein